ncbi:hypothetical protein N325_11852, partial [Colius striatus]
IPRSQDDKGYNLYDHLQEDPASPSSIATMPESMDCGQDYSEDSCSNSVISQHGADLEDSSSSSHHGAEDHHQEMDLMSPTLKEKHLEGMIENMYFPPGFQLRRSQSTHSNSSASFKFPVNNNFGETDNFVEDSEIFLFVK